MIGNNIEKEDEILFIEKSKNYFNELRNLLDYVEKDFYNIDEKIKIKAVMISAAIINCLDTFQVHFEDLLKIVDEDLKNKKIENLTH